MTYIYGSTAECDGQYLFALFTLLFYAILNNFSLIRWEPVLWWEETRKTRGTPLTIHKLRRERATALSLRCTSTIKSWTQEVSFLDDKTIQNFGSTRAILFKYLGQLFDVLHHLLYFSCFQNFHSISSVTNYHNYLHSYIEIQNYQTETTWSEIYIKTLVRHRSSFFKNIKHISQKLTLHQKTSRRGSKKENYSHVPSKATVNKWIPWISRQLCQFPMARADYKWILLGTIQK